MGGGMKRILVVVLLFLWQPLAIGQLLIPDVVKPYDKIVAGCECIIPQNGEASFEWTFDKDSQYEISHDGFKAYVWSPPGAHSAEVLVVIKTYKDIFTVIVDPADPENHDKWKLQKTRVLDAVDWNHYVKKFQVSGSPGPDPGPVPPPPGPAPPGPGPAPTPSPSDPLAKQIQVWLKAVPTQYYTKDKVNAFANVYSSVASRAVATSDVPNLESFLTLTKTGNAAVVNNDPAEAEAWRTPFFVPLGKEIQTMYTTRNLQPTDVKGIAQLWNDVAAAIKAGAL
jgi:hypothetical protein